MKIKKQIYKGLTYWGKELIGQLLIVENSVTIIPDKSLSFDGHHICQDYDSALWIRPDSLEFLYETEVEVDI